jgi:hypothetical protein
MGRAVLLAVALCCFVVGNGRAATQGSELTLTDADLLKACTQTDYEWMDFCNDYYRLHLMLLAVRAYAPPRAFQETNCSTSSSREFLWSGQVECRQVACRNWGVSTMDLSTGVECLLYPTKRTCSASKSVSALCH